MKILLKFILLFTLMLSCLLFGGCKEKEPVCAHEWSNSTCISPKTCTKCGETTGEYGNHFLKAATCEEPAVCYFCGEKSGNPRGHIFVGTGCEEPKACRRCDKTDGIVLGHDYAPATCTEPEKCTRCKEEGETKALGHNFDGLTCSACEETVTITTYKELDFFLGQNFNKIHTAMGTIGVSFDYKEYDSLFDSHDLDIKMETNTFYLKEYKRSLNSILFYVDFSYEDRKQAFLDVLDFEMKIAKVVEEAFPGKKVSIYFYESGYKYPSLGLGFHSETYLPFKNWNNEGICDWYMHESMDTFLSCSQTSKHQPCGLHDDVRAERPQYDLKFKGYIYE